MIYDRFSLEDQRTLVKLLSILDLLLVCHTVTLSHMLGLTEGSLRELEEGERVVDSRSKKTLSCFVLLGLRIEVLVGNTGSSLPCSRHCFKFSAVLF